MSERNLYSGFDIAGGRVSAYMPNTPEEELEWTVEFVRGGEVLHTGTIAMIHPPIFGPDVEDVSYLNLGVEKFITEWGLE